MRELPAALAPLGAYRQFIVVALIPSQTRPGKTEKYPIDFRTGHIPPKGTGGAHWPEIWTNAETAINVAAQMGPGYTVGFVFTENDPFWFLDIDHCLVDGQWSPLAVGLCQALSGAAVEVSQSGQGLHLFGSGRVPAHGCRCDSLGLEFYTEGRFVALTGVGAIGSAAADFSHILPALVAQYFPVDTATAVAQAWTDGPVPEWKGPSDDAELIRRALKSRSSAAAFGGKASFADLWTENVEVLAKVYPDDARPYNASQADAALAQHLAFWTGKDCERIVRLMGQSKLAREKWDREDYLPRTVLGAVGRQLDVLVDKSPEPVAQAAPKVSHETPAPQMVTGGTFVSIEDQLTLFKGCVYIRDQHRVLVPGGVLLKPEQFKVNYGGYSFPMDLANEKVSRDAWEAFTQSQAFRCPRVDSPCFKPDLPPGAIVERGGQTFVNTYWPVNVPRKQGDVSPFMDHLRRVIPHERDRLIALSYMAACVQHVGVKFQWALFIQGVEGNGKTLFSRCVAEAVGRRYVHWPQAAKIAEKFNGWMVGKVFFAVEDIYVPGDRAEVFEILKPMITGGDGLEIEGKGVDQISADICGNFILNSNHKDGIRKTANDRRFCHIFSAQQEAADLVRDGMHGQYFPELYKWLRADGYAIVNNFLHTFPIPDEYNPATGCQRAPDTTSTATAIAASAGGIEQEINEAVSQGLPGFCGGWISTIQLDRLLERLGASRRLTHSKRKEMLESMGYMHHPALHDGRVNNIITPDGGKPRLFIRRDHPSAQIASPADAARAYEAANNTVARLPFSV